MMTWEKIENKGKIIADKTYFDRHIKDDNIQIHYIGSHSQKQALAFNRDLIWEDFRVYEHYESLNIDFHNDQNQRVKIYL